MSRSLPADSETLLRKLIRDGLPIREIAKRVKCGVGTVTRRKKELGYAVRVQVSQRVTKLLAPQQVEPQMVDAGPPPSLAARRLAVFDPVIARALAKREVEDSDDGE